MTRVHIKKPLPKITYPTKGIRKILPAGIFRLQEEDGSSEDGTSADGTSQGDVTVVCAFCMSDKEAKQQCQRCHLIICNCCWISYHECLWMKISQVPWQDDAEVSQSQKKHCCNNNVKDLLVINCNDSCCHV